MTTRRRHFGSVRKLPSGRFQASWWHEGERHVAETTFAAKADALSYLATVEAGLARGVTVDPRAGRISVADLADEWLRSNPGKRQGSLERDQIILRLHVLPTLGQRQVSGVTKIDVQDLVTAWSSVRAPRTVRRQYDVLRALFSYAEQTDRIARTPCRSIKLPQPEALSRPHLGPDAILRLAAATRDEFRPMVWLGGMLGLRWGEVAGLWVSALDFTRHEVRVERQLGRDGRLGPPKSAAGRRSMTMPTPLNELLQRHVANYCTDDPRALVFTSQTGTPLDYSHWRRRVWAPAVSATGLDGASFHDLRRAAATLLVLEGVDVKTAQTRLGHSDPRITLGIYAQASSAADRDAADRLGSRFFGADRDR